MSQAKTVLFLCTGNYYRSRFAEILFNSVADKMRLNWRAGSRGLAVDRSVNNVGPIAAEAVREVKARGISAATEIGRLPLQVTPSDFSAADWVIALKETEHRPLLNERFPDWTAKVEFWHVDDAPGALTLIEPEVMDLAARLIMGGRPRTPGPRVIVPAAKLSTPTTKPAKSLGTVKVGRETAGRRGKGVTTVFDLPLKEDALLELAATLKQRCGTGGTVKDGRIEIQGDQRDRLVMELEKLGYTVKRAGG